MHNSKKKSSRTTKTSRDQSVRSSRKRSGKQSSVRYPNRKDEITKEHFINAVQTFGTTNKLDLQLGCIFHYLHAICQHLNVGGNVDAENSFIRSVGQEFEAVVAWHSTHDRMKVMNVKGGKRK